MKKFLTIIAAVLLSVSCSTDEEKGSGGYQPSGDPIRFEATTGEAFTRAVTGEIGSNENLKTLTFESHPSGGEGLRGFGVFAAYTGPLKYENTTVSADFMYNQQVTYNTAWEYNPVKYWPNETNDYVSFFAYAPYEPSPDDDGRCIIDISKNTDMGDPWVNYRLSKDPWGTDGDPKTEPQLDLMYAFNNTGTGAAKWYDQTKTAGEGIGHNERLMFTFNHALGCFAHEVTLQLSDELRAKLNGYATITINSFNITYNNLTNKARLILNPEISSTTPTVAYANWKEIISGELTVSRTTGDITKYPTSDGEKSLNDVDPAKALSFDLTKTATADPAKKISEDRGLLYIPIIIAGQPKPTVTVTLNYTITNNASTSYIGSVSKDIDLSDYHQETYQGKKIGLALTLTKDLDLAHLVYTLDSTPATEPSYIRKR